MNVKIERMTVSSLSEDGKFLLMQIVFGWL